MLFSAKSKYNVNLKNVFISDRWRDVVRNKVGVKLFINRNYNEKLNSKPKYIVKNIKKFTNLLNIFFFLTLFSSICTNLSFF